MSRRVPAPGVALATTSGTFTPSAGQRAYEVYSEGGKLFRPWAQLSLALQLKWEVIAQAAQPPKKPRKPSATLPTFYTLRDGKPVEVKAVDQRFYRFDRRKVRFGPGDERRVSRSDLYPTARTAVHGQCVNARLTVRHLVKRLKIAERMLAKALRLKART